MDTGLEDKVVLVTGGSGGIGQELVRAFAAERARVVIHYHRNQEAAEAVAQSLSGPVMTVAADLTDEAEVDRLFDAIEGQWQGVDCVVANAGVWPPDHVPLQHMSLSQWNDTLAADLTSAFLTVRRFLRGIERFQLQCPSAILIGSTAAVFGEAGHGDYAAAKAGLVYGMLPTLKNELARLAPGGRVNAVCPGWTMTPMTAKFADQTEAKTRALQTIALRKFARPTDIAAAVVFLASDKLAGHLSGQRLVVSGGMEGRQLYAADEVDGDSA